MSTNDNGHIIETAREARGGESGPTVRNVLIISIALVIIGFAIVWLLFFRT